MQFFLLSCFISVLFTLVCSRAVQLEQRDDRPRAVYILDDDPNGASIIALSIGLADGKVSSPKRTSTGGKGSFTLAPIGPPPPDPLNSQDSVVVSRDYLFTINAGSNNLVMFTIDPAEPTHLTMVGKPVDTLGEFPVSVSYSPKLHTVCVLNSGAINGVACFSVDHATGLTPLDTKPRSLSPAINQSTPPVNLNYTGSDIFFNPSQTALFATTKGDFGTSTKAGSIFAWPVIDRKVSTTPVVSVIPELIINWGSVFANDDTLFITEPITGAAQVKIGADFRATETIHIPFANTTAICWSVWSLRFNAVYLVDGANPSIVPVDPITGAKRPEIRLDTATIGALDSAIDRTSLYVQTASGDLAVIDLEGSNSGKVPRQIQSLHLSDQNTLMGVATYPS